MGGVVEGKWLKVHLQTIRPYEPRQSAPKCVPWIFHLVPKIIRVLTFSLFVSTTASPFCPFVYSYFACILHQFCHPI